MHGVLVHSHVQQDESANTSHVFGTSMGKKREGCCGRCSCASRTWNIDGKKGRVAVKAAVVRGVFESHRAPECPRAKASGGVSPTFWVE